jgi:SAM-dependent methyltransferase
LCRNVAKSNMSPNYAKELSGLKNHQLARLVERYTSANSAKDYYTFDEWTWARFKFSLGAFQQRIRDSALTKLSGDFRRSALQAAIKLEIAQARAWGSYDYGLGYLYQSFSPLGLSGRRNTERRVAAASLIERTRGRSILDIGCNAGFISLSLAPTAKQVTGFDFNPHLVAVANRCSRYLELENTRFLVSSFADFPETERFDVVMSLSNHVTFDGPVFPTFQGYLEKCARLLNKGGLIVFESHTPAFEARAEGIEGLLPKLREQFVEVSINRSEIGTALDRGRLLYIGRQG